MWTFPRVLLSVLLILAIGCSDSPYAPESTGDRAAVGAFGLEMRDADAGAQAISVFSRNIYVGTDIMEVLDALTDDDPDNDIPVFMAAVEVLLATDFPTRAVALADEIERDEPDVIGLQEVYYVEIIVPPFNIFIIQDYLSILMQELADRGLDYSVAAEVTNTDAVLPDFGVRLTDHDVILAKSDRVEVHAADGQLFNNNIGDVGIGFELVRGWTMIDATIAGMELEIWNTHLESGADPMIEGLRALQAGELVSMASMAMPVVILGDFNDVPGSLMYGVMTDVGGCEDVWLEMRPGADGFTSTHWKDLSNHNSVLFERIDFVFSRGLGHPQAGLLGQIKLTGNIPSDKVEGPYYMIWPSDHAGILTRFLMPPANG